MMNDASPEGLGLPDDVDVPNEPIVSVPPRGALATLGQQIMHPPKLGFFAGTPVGRGLLSIMCGFVVFVLIVWNLPNSHLRRQLAPNDVVYTLALDQNWGVFSPNPTTTSIRVEADVYLADGRVLHHVFPEGDNFLGGLSEYRWRKWERRVRLDSNSRLWRPTAEWVAAQYLDRQPTKVVLIRYFSTTPPPGSNQERVWDSFEFYELPVVG